MMQLAPYLSFRGDCEAAFKFYEKALGGKIVAMVTFGETPMKDQSPPEWHGKIAHARLTAGDAVLMGGDPPPTHYEVPKGASVCLTLDEPAQAERVFGALSDGGAVQMPIAETFWAQRFGMLTDRFGIPWMINCEKPHG
jgi:PhnB protein